MIQLTDLAGKDPYLSYGFGLIAYRGTLFALCIFFIFMSILMYPVILAFESGTAITSSVHTTYGNHSIANLGYSSIQCQTVPFTMKTVVMSCPYGNITEIYKQDE